MPLNPAEFIQSQENFALTHLSSLLQACGWTNQAKFAPNPKSAGSKYTNVYAMGTLASANAEVVRVLLTHPVPVEPTCPYQPNGFRTAGAGP